MAGGVTSDVRVEGPGREAGVVAGRHLPVGLVGILTIDHERFQSMPIG